MDQKPFSSVGEAFIYIQDTLMRLILPIESSIQEFMCSTNDEVVEFNNLLTDVFRF